MLFRAFRGLVVGLALSGLNFVGALLTLLALGGLEEWSRSQFLGLFGVFEVARGLSFLVCPNIWRLPIAEVNTGRRTRVRLAASTVLAPHWGAAANCLAGVILCGVALAQAGATAVTLLLPLEVVFCVGIYISASLLAARLGVAHPERDVFFFVLKRPGHEDHEYPGISAGAMCVQFVLGIGTFPAVKLLSSSVLYRPEFAPSAGLLAWTGAIAALLGTAAFAAWNGRLAWRAPREQQREAERFA